MAQTGKNLVDAQLASSKGTLYTTPGSTTTYPSRGTLLNTDAAAVTATIYVKAASTSRKVWTGSLDAGGFADISAHLHVLEAGDLIEGEASVASKVDCVISGVEKT